MLKKLILTRKSKGYTQKQVALLIGVSESHYKKIEYGTYAGSIKVWDKLEDLFGISQRQLREQED